MTGGTSRHDPFAELQAWYAGECDGDWEHSYGVTIETLDNPGWNLEIDLEETSLACRAQEPVNIRTSDDDWLMIFISDDKFIASGDPGKLPQMLEAFSAFRRAAAEKG